MDKNKEVETIIKIGDKEEEVIKYAKQIICDTFVETKKEDIIHFFDYSMPHNFIFLFPMPKAEKKEEYSRLKLIISEEFISSKDISEIKAHINSELNRIYSKKNI